MKTGMEEEILKTANTEYLNLLGDERQMKRNPDLVQSKDKLIIQEQPLSETQGQCSLRISDCGPTGLF